MTFTHACKRIHSLSFENGCKYGLKGLLSDFRDVLSAHTRLAFLVLALFRILLETH